jgi:hypothetical protein
LNRIRVGLQPLVANLNLPTVIKTTVFPGEEDESLVIATQVGEIFYIGDNAIETLLDMTSNVIELGSNGGYDERGLLGLAFHPDFSSNGLFYLHYSVTGSQGPGALSGSFIPNPCYSVAINLSWTDRENRYDHIDTVEEWILQESEPPIKRRTLMNLRRPFMNHNGINSLNFSPETDRLVLTTGDGGSGYDPFNLSQDMMEIAGKIIEIDVSMDVFLDDVPIVTRFDEFPESIQKMLTVIAKGVRNITGIAFHRFNNYYIKYVGNVGQDMVESIFSFVNYRPIPVSDIIQSSNMNTQPIQDGFINFGWRGWEGDLPTTIINPCSGNSKENRKIIAYYDEAIETSTKRINPLTCFYHQDSRPDKFQAVALTGVQPYQGISIPELTGSCLFTNWAQSEDPQILERGVLAYTWPIPDCKLQDYEIIDVAYDFGQNAAYYTCLGTNLGHSRLFLGVYGSANVANLNQGTIYEIVRI